jgi:leucyl aminopeptidase
MLELISVDLKRIKTDALVIPVVENTDIYDKPLITSIVKDAMKLKEFNGRKGDELTLYTPPELNATRVMLIGLGKLQKIDRESFRRLAGKAVNKCINNNLNKMLVVVPAAEKIKMEITGVLEGLFEGVCLSNHRFDKYKQEKKLKPLQKISLLVAADVAQKYKKLPAQVAARCKGTTLAREWVNTPANHKKPAQFTQTIVQLAKKENLKTRVLDEKELTQKKFGAILAVAAGSQSPPRLVVIEYNPKGAKNTVALVGKGVTFDSGGMNLKTSATLNLMKVDMAGAAVVAATLITVAKLKPRIRVIGILPLVENMLSGAATRPGDIIRSYEGKTVEIGNMDAEGRLILIDAIAYTVKTFKPDMLIDIATLTGACAMALGDRIAGVFSFDDELAEAILQAGEKTHERCWRMPLPEDYKELLKSELADINNMSRSAWGGAITAALFLSEFVGTTRWAHIDIAGPAYHKKGHDYSNAGATGFGVRLLYDLLEKL